MELDAKTVATFLAPLAIAYMTWSSVTSTVASTKDTGLKPINVGQLATAPKMPSAEAELRDPFIPEGALSAGLAPGSAAKTTEAKDNEPLHLDGTVLAGKLRFAVINGTRVMEGDFFRGLKLDKVEASRVVLSGGKQETILPLEIAKSDAIQPLTIAAAGADTPERAPATATGGMGKSGGMGATSGGMGKSTTAKKPAAGGGMGAKQAPKGGGGGMGH